MLLAILQIVPGDSLIASIINMALVLVIGPAATYLMTELSKFVLKAEAWSAFAKRVLVFAWATVILGINHALGISLPEAFGALTQPDIQLLLTAGLTYLAHQVLNKPAA